MTLSTAAIRAAIRRASLRARGDLESLDERAAADLLRLYRRAADEMRAEIAAAADGTGNVRLEVLADLAGQIDRRARALAGDRNRLLDDVMAEAARVGVSPFAADTGIGVDLIRVAEDAIRFSREFVAADGLQLSDRIWRIDNATRREIADAIEGAVIRGHSAHRTIIDLLSRGESVPADLAAKVAEASADGIGRDIAGRLLTGEDNAYYNAERLVRTELNRAHGEAYRAAMSQTPGVIGERFVLSPTHPRPDICDLHASANLHGLGPGVYPVGKSPWPAHPNTLSYLEPVFADEITDDDRAGKQTRLDWLRQNPDKQYTVLGRGKQAALDRGLLKENQIATPWRVLKRRYERQGIDTDKLTRSA